MSGTAQPDPAFLHNVPTSTSQTSSSTPSSSSISSTSASTTTDSNSLTSTSATTTSTSATSPTSATSSTSTSTPALDSLYFYKPSLPIALVFSILYFALVPYHFYHAIYTPHISKSVHQKHKYTIPLFIATVLSTLGFSLRVVSVSTDMSRQSIPTYAASNTGIIVAPIFVCATLYLLIAHLIRLCLPEGKERVFLGISPRWLGRVFVTSDVLSFLCQGAGSAIAASGGWTGSQKTLGTNVLIFGLAAQLATFTMYMVVLGLFCQRVGSGHVEGIGNDRDSPRRASFSHEHERSKEASREFGFNPLVKQVVKGMWIANVLVEIRSTYRTIESGMGVNGYLFQHEWPLWVFEAAPIWLALLVLGMYHPTKWLQQKRRSAFVDKYARTVSQQLSGLPK